MTDLIQSRVLAAALLGTFGRTIPLPAPTRRPRPSKRRLVNDERAFQRRVERRRKRKGYA